MKSENERFDSYWKAALEASSLLKDRWHHAQQMLHECRRNAYRMTKAIMVIREKFMAEFIEQVHSIKTETGARMTVELWLDQQFAVIESMGDSQRDIEAGIAKGMTEKDYLNLGRDWHIKAGKSELVKREREAIGTAPPPVTMPAEERAAYAIRCWDEAKRIIAEQGRSLRILEAENDRLRKLVESMKRRLDRALAGFSARSGNREIAVAQ